MIAGRYSFSERVGRGWSGALWLGLDERTGQRVVLEQVGPAGVDDDYRARAEREARAATGFVHPHAATVLDFVADNQTGLLWLVSEPVEGMTLTEVVQRSGTHDMEFTLDVARQTAEALAAAHAEGVVHGNVSPDNISVDRLGHVTVTGFGVARMPVQPGPLQQSVGSGASAYLAPEVAAGEIGDEASDVWSFGATLYFAMTGGPPYDTGPDLPAGLERIIAVPPPRLPNAGLLGSLLEVTMVKDTWQRWSMAAVHDRLTAPFDGLTDPMTPAPAPRRSAPPIGWKLPALLAAALLAAAAIGVIVLDKQGGGSITAPVGQPHRPLEHLPASASSSSPGSSAGSRSSSAAPSPAASRVPPTSLPPSSRARRAASPRPSTKHASHHRSTHKSRHSSKHQAKHPAKHSRPHGHQGRPSHRDQHGSRHGHQRGSRHGHQRGHG